MVIMLSIDPTYRFTLLFVIDTHNKVRRIEVVLITLQMSDQTLQILVVPNSFASPTVERERGSWRAHLGNELPGWQMCARCNTTGPLWYTSNSGVYMRSLALFRQRNLDWMCTFICRRFNGAPANGVLYCRHCNHHRVSYVHDGARFKHQIGCVAYRKRWFEFVLSFGSTSNCRVCCRRLRMFRSDGICDTHSVSWNEYFGWTSISYMAAVLSAFTLSLYWGRCLVATQYLMLNRNLHILMTKCCHRNVSAIGTSVR